MVEYGKTSSALDRLTLRQLLFSVCLILLLLLAGVSVFVGWRAREFSLGAGASQIDGKTALLAASLKSEVLKEVVFERSFLLTADPLELKKLAHERDTFSEQVQELSTLQVSGQGRQLLDQAMSLFTQYSGRSDAAIAAVQAGSKEEGIKIALDASPLRVQATDAFEAVKTYYGDNFARHLEEGHRSALQTTRLLIVITVLGFALGVWLAWKLVGILSRRVETLAAVFQSVANRDLSCEDIAVHTDDAIGQALHSVNLMKASLGEVILDLASGSHQLAVSSKEIIQAAGDSSYGAAKQTDSAEKLSAAIQEMTQTVEHISSSTNRMLAATERAFSAAGAGDQVVEQTVQSIQDIEASNNVAAESVRLLGDQSKNIGKIVKVIGEIAQQTELLALNASIEAARAGAHGKGFAVVANEVRQLAERTSSAVGEIGQIVRVVQTTTGQAVDAMSKGSERVILGVERARQARASLEAIVAAVKDVNQMVSGISSAASEQSASSREMAGGVKESLHLAGQARSAAEFTENACKQLSELASGIDEIVKTFRLPATRGKSSGARSYGLVHSSMRQKVVAS